MPSILDFESIQEHLFSLGRVLYSYLAVEQGTIVKRKFSNALSNTDIVELGVAIRSIPRIWGLIGHSIYCAVLFPEFKDKPMLHYFSAFVAGFGGGTIASVFTLAYGKGAPLVALFVDNSVFITWTVAWWLMNHFPGDPFGRLHRSNRLFRVLTLLGLTFTRTNTIIFRANAISALLPEAQIVAPILLPALAACGGRFLSDIIRVSYGFWGHGHRLGWGGGPAWDEQAGAMRSQHRPTITGSSCPPRSGGSNDGDAENNEGEDRDHGSGNDTDDCKVAMVMKKSSDSSSTRPNVSPTTRAGSTAPSPSSSSSSSSLLILSSSSSSPSSLSSPSSSSSSSSSPSSSPPSSSLSSPSLSLLRPSELSVPNSSFRTAIGFAALYVFLGRALWPRRVLETALDWIASSLSSSPSPSFLSSSSLSSFLSSFLSYLSSSSSTSSSSPTSSSSASSSSALSSLALSSSRGIPMTLLHPDAAYAVVMLTAVAHSLSVEFLGLQVGDFTRPIAAAIHRVVGVPMSTAPIAIDWAKVLAGTATNGTAPRTEQVCTGRGRTASSSSSLSSSSSTSTSAKKDAASSSSSSLPLSMAAASAEVRLVETPLNEKLNRLDLAFPKSPRNEVLPGNRHEGVDESALGGRKKRDEKRASGAGERRSGVLEDGAKAQDPLPKKAQGSLPKKAQGSLPKKAQGLSTDEAGKDEGRQSVKGGWQTQARKSKKKTT